MTEKKNTEEQLKEFIDSEAQKFSAEQDNFDTKEAIEIWSIFENDYLILGNEVVKGHANDNVFNEIKAKIEKVVKRDD